MSAFLSAIGLIVFSTSAWRDQPALLLTGFALGFVCFGFFVGLVLKHHRIDERGERYRRLKTINEHACRRLERAWNDFPTPKAPESLRDLTIARDLDLFGSGSLFHLTCTADTPQGRFTLSSWLTRPTDPSELGERHQAIRELAPQLDWRQEMRAKGMALAHETDEQPIRSWSSQKPWFSDHPGVLKFAKILPLLLLTLVALTVVTDRHWWIFGIAAHWLFTRCFQSQLNKTLRTISKQEKPLRHYVNVFGHVEELIVECPRLTTLKEKLSSAHQGMKQLSHLATQAEARGSLGHLILQYLVLWDFHIAAAVEAWQAKHEDNVDTWFQALGEIEALASLANLHDDEPEWAFPNFETGGVLAAKQLGHPLILAKVRIGNDVTLGPPGKFLLITGSNMSGKSTLLRSIGLNVTLAQAGAPVCATSLKLSSFQLGTSMRVEESLTDGVSYFMAELKGIKDIVQMANDAAAPGKTESHVLYLLDEILKGTNSEERQIIVRRVLTHLVGQGAIGAVTTHDFALAEIEDFKEVSQLGHFREAFSETKNGMQMTFDHKLRPGVATTTNAVKLLEIIDLQV